MENNKEQLMKHFASVLRGRALGKLETPSVDPNISRYFKRKELIEIIKKRFEGTIPKEHNLVEMENQQLLDLVGDEMFIIAYITEKWSKEIPEVKPIKTTLQKNVSLKSKKTGNKKE